MQKIKKPVQLIFLSCLIFIVGYYRELFFLVINSVIENSPYVYNVSYVKVPDLLYQLSNSFLINIKWGLTFLFSFTLMCLAIFCVKLFFNSKKNSKLIVIIYLSICFLAVLLYLIGLLFNVLPIIYPISRYLIGLPQSPLLVLLVFSIIYIREKI